VYHLLITNIVLYEHLSQIVTLRPLVAFDRIIWFGHSTLYVSVGMIEFQHSCHATTPRDPIVILQWVNFIADPPAAEEDDTSPSAILRRMSQIVEMLKIVFSTTSLYLWAVGAHNLCWICVWFFSYERVCARKIEARAREYGERDSLGEEWSQFLHRRAVNFIIYYPTLSL